MKRLPHPRRLFTLLLYAGGALIIALAALATSIRLFLPYADDYRAVVQEMASDALGQPVTIGGLEARIGGLTPSLTFTDIALVSRGSGEPVIRAAALEAVLNLSATLERRQPVFERLVISGADLALETGAGGIRITGIGGAAGGGEGADAVTAWLLAQPHLEVKESRLVWRHAGYAPQRIERITLRMRNDGGRHRLSGLLDLPPELGGRVRLGVDLNGDTAQVADWSGRAYFQGQALQAGRWLSLSGRELPVSLERGTLDAQLWGTVEGGRFTSVEGSAVVADAGLNGIRGRMALSRAGARFRWRPTEAGWRLRLAELEIEREGRRWPESALEVTQENGAVRLQAQYLRLDDLAQAAALVPAVSEEQYGLIASLKLGGELRALRLEREPGQPLRIQAGFHNLRVAPHGKVPGVQGLDGELRLAGDEVRLDLDSADATLDIPTLFRDPLRIDRLEGRFGLDRDEAGWQLQGRSLRFANADIEGELEADIAVAAAGGAPYLDLRGRFRDGNAMSVSRYLPVAIMPDSAVRWLDAAFRAGRVTEGSVLFHGRGSDFPFRNDEGRFDVRFGTEGVELAFQDGWPHLTGVSGEVVFDGPGMVIEADQGRFLDGRVQSARVAIPDLRRGRLMVDGGGRIGAADILRALRETPLSRFVSRDVLSQLRAQGPAALGLHLEIPLTRGQPPLVARGDVDFHGDSLFIGERLAIHALNGRFRFDGTDFRADGLAGNMFSEPVRLSVATQQGLTSVSAHGRASAEALRKSFDLAYLERMTGSSEWDAMLRIPHDGEGAEVRVGSELEGIGVDLPPPLAKSSDGMASLRLVRHLSGPREGHVEVSYGPRFRAALALEQDKVDRAAVHFGTAMPDLPSDRRIRITGSLLGVVPSEWGKALPGGSGGPGLPVEVAMYRLQLADGGRTAHSGGSGARPDLSPLDVKIQRLEYGDMRLGALSFRAAPRSGRVQFLDVSVSGEGFEMSGAGEWRGRPGGSSTHFDLTLNAPNIGRMMESLGFVNVISKGETAAGGRITWSGGPADFALERLGGELQVEVKDGRIDDVDPGSGRLLGLFSLQALPRRLRLDFTDLFRKGLVFDGIRGNLRLEDGNAYTSDLVMETPTAEVLMEGRTGFARQDYDLLVTVVPNVSDALPVVGGLAWGPQAGAIIWVLQKMLGGQINKASQFQYTVEGPWEAPDVNRLPRAETVGAGDR